MLAAKLSKERKRLYMLRELIRTRSEIRPYLYAKVVEKDTILALSIYLLVGDGRRPGCPGLLQQVIYERKSLT